MLNMLSCPECIGLQVKNEQASPGTALLLQNTRGLSFYATPQGGSDMMSMAVRLVMLLSPQLEWSAAVALMDVPPLC